MTQESRWGGSAYQPAKLHSCGKSTHPAFRAGATLLRPRPNLAPVRSSSIGPSVRHGK